MAKRDLYAEITGKIVTMLESGTMPWRRPWDDGGLGVHPLRQSGEKYRGINVLFLWAAAAGRGFCSPYWMTYRQATALDAQVKRGSRSESVIYVGSFERERESDGEKYRVSFLKSYSVFNVEEIEGLPAKYYPAPIKPNDWARIKAAETFFDGIAVDLRHGGNRACYNPASDHVQMPERGAFHDAEGYYSTLAHELGHWTGSDKRLDRQFGKRFGNETYAFEELIAELSAAFTCAHLGIVNQPRDETASYIASWIKVLKGDTKAIFTAASQADKATEYLIDASKAEIREAA